MEKESKKMKKFSFLLGLIISALLFAVIISSLFDLKLKKGHQKTLLGEKQQYAFLRKHPSKELLVEIKSFGGNFEYVTNLGDFSIGTHYSFAVTPHPKLGSRLRKNISMRGHYLKSRAPQALNRFENNIGLMRNLNPPVLYLNNKFTYSKDLEDYVKSESTVSYLASSDEFGFRSTLPVSNGKKEVLFIGDSVAFGLGVDDQSTIASHLQQKIGDEYKVINAALSGYGTDQNFAMLDEFKGRHFSHLIYVICENDIYIGSSREDQIAFIIDRIKRDYLKDFDNVTLVLHSYIFRAILHLSSYDDQVEPMNDAIKRLVISKTKGTNISFLSWLDIVKEYSTEIKKTVFAADALYVDQCHFSSEGNELLASRIQKSSF